MDCKLFKLYFMNENYVQRDAMSASMDNELLKVLIDKTVDNGTAIRETQEQIRKLGPDAVATGLDQRLGFVEERVGAKVQEQIGELAARVEVIGKQVGRLGAQLGEPSGWLLDSMRSLTVSLEGCIDFFSKPMQKEVHHRHFLGWPVWVLSGMLIVIGLQWMGLTNAWSKVDLHEQNDLLWRAARLLDDSTVTRALDKVVRDFNADSGQFRKDLVAEEERRAELYEKWRQVNERMGRIHELEKVKKR